MKMQVHIIFQYFEARHQFNGRFEDLNSNSRYFQEQFEELDNLNPVVDLVQRAYASPVSLKICPCS